MDNTQEPDVVSLLSPGGIRNMYHSTNHPDVVLMPHEEQIVSLPGNLRASDYGIGMTSGRVRVLADTNHKHIGSAFHYRGDTYMIHDIDNPKPTTEELVEEQVNIVPVIIVIATAIVSILVMSAIYTNLPPHASPFAAILWLAAMTYGIFTLLKRMPLTNLPEVTFTLVPVWSRYEHDYQIVLDHEPWLMSSFTDSIYRAQIFGDKDALNNAVSIVDKAWDRWRMKHAHPEDR